MTETKTNRPTVKPRREKTVKGVRYVLVNGGWKRSTGGK